MPRRLLWIAATLPLQVGLLLVKELLQYKMSKDVPVAALKLRSLPR